MFTFYLEHIIIAAIISLIIGPIIIPELRKLKIGQSIREEGPKSHLQKAGTPTMGGIIFMFSTLVTLLVFGIKDSKIYICLMSMLGFGLIGFIDDYIKVVKKRNLGLRAYQKMSGQIVFSFLLIFFKMQIKPSTSIVMPFANLGRLDLGLLYYPITMFVIVGTVNSVNLTDGLDGLASSVSILSLIGFGIITIATNQHSIAMYGLTVAGSLLGFLNYNRFPAKVFMGDVGSLAIGGAFAAIAVLSDTILLLPIIGIIFVIETLSVIIQVLSVKLRGKRVFLMSPIHHHFEALGWSETKVVFVFSVITLIFTAIGVISIL